MCMWWGLLPGWGPELSSWACALSNDDVRKEVTSGLEFCGCLFRTLNVYPTFSTAVRKKWKNNTKTQTWGYFQVWLCFKASLLSWSLGTFGMWVLETLHRSLPSVIPIRPQKFPATREVHSEGPLATTCFHGKAPARTPDSFPSCTWHQGLPSAHTAQSILQPSRHRLLWARQTIEGNGRPWAQVPRTVTCGLR